MAHFLYQLLWVTISYFYLDLTKRAVILLDDATSNANIYPAIVSVKNSNKQISTCSVEMLFKTFNNSVPLCL